MKNLTNQLWTAYQSSTLKEEDFQYFSQMIEDLVGINIRSSKYDMVKTRLRHRLVDHGLANYEEYRALLESLPHDDEEWQHFINLLTTNKTDFFREPAHFHYLIETILPEWLKSDEKVFKVWSAASSTGEEAYTLAMILQHYMPKNRDFQVIATDIDTNVLASGENGVYNMARFKDIPEFYREESTDVGEKEVKGWFRIKPELKKKVIFKQHNLIDNELPFNENEFDLILCRNVLIYFEPQSIQLVANKLYKAAKLGSYLFIGHSESLQGLDHKWALVNPSIYHKCPL